MNAFHKRTVCFLKSFVSWNLKLQINEQMKRQANYMTFDLDNENHFENDDEDDYFNELASKRFIWWEYLNNFKWE
jgi:hypothetical protein